MRPARALIALLLAIGVVAPAGAQTSDTPEPVKPVERATSTLRLEVARWRLGWEVGRAPEARDFARGGRTIAAGDTVRGDAAVVDGPLAVHGTVRGDALAVNGDVIIHPGGRVTGDVATHGGLPRILPGGLVEGQVLTLGGNEAAAAPLRRDVPNTTWENVKLVLGLLGIFAVIGVGVLVFAEGTLTEAVESLQQRFGRAFWVGIVVQLAVIPVLVVLSVALVLTVVGILLLPFAIVAYVVAVAGLFTFGLLAAARLAGGAMRGPVRASGRSQHLGALARGLLLFFALWMVAAAFTWSPLLGAVLRAVALAATWMAVTLGVGATMASRFAPRRAVPTGRMDPLAWQTPTPVAGVAAARRPQQVTLERA